MTEPARTTGTAKQAGWRKTVGVGCGFGIVAAICLGIGLTFGVTMWLQIGFAIGTVAVVLALIGAYDHFFNGD